MVPEIDLQYRRARARVWQADAMQVLGTLKPGSISLIISSPPYFMGKEYDKSLSPDDFIAQHKEIFPIIANLLKPGGSICWQTGCHVRNNKVIPLDALVYSVAQTIPDLILRNRIIWRFNHGAHGVKRFSGRHETILWYTKGDEYPFNLDEVRVPQLYPGKRHYKGPNKGKWSGNPLGKNPGDVWDIPNVKARHVEKTGHPCQFPTALVRRFVRALTGPGDVVLDPFAGSGTSCVVALAEGRHFVGCETQAKYVTIIRKRLADLSNGCLPVRADVPVRSPRRTESVAIAPPHFAIRAQS
jgi:adenine-specific DNA-methyltransferase